MALGLTRDSYIKLASLTSEESEKNSPFANAPELPPPGESTVVSLAVKEEGAEKFNDAGSHSSVSSGSKSEKASPEKESSYGAYSGFALDYAEYDVYNDPYAPDVLGGGGGNKNIFCCLFAPWLVGRDRMVKPEDVPSEHSGDDSDRSQDGGAAPAAESVEVTTEAVVDHPNPRSNRQDSRSDDENSTGSDVLGDRLTEKERSAVLARLRIAQPDTPLMSDPPIPTGKGLLNGMPGQSEEERPRKGILKRTSSLKGSASSLARRSTTGGPAAPGQRRSLFPVYSSRDQEKAVDNRHLRFAPMARVVTVKSRKDMNIAEKMAVWWQRSDYDDFKKTGRLVAKAMLQGGSEVWLMTNKSWQAPGTKKAVLGKTSNAADEPDEEDLDNKWWHKFGHSRRGLEHIASMEEGKQRQINVRVAVRGVLDEQRKQRMYGKNDQEKIRSVYHQLSSWARELSIAAGASDAEAVRSNFSEQRHSREFYLLKHRVKSGGTAPRHVPDFMKPLSNVTPQNLDANTRTQLRMRKKVAQTTEAIHDPVPHPGKSIAKQAAAFGTSDENVSMAAVLSGSGVGMGVGSGVGSAVGSSVGMSTVGTNPTRTSVGAH